MRWSDVVATLQGVSATRGHLMRSWASTLSGCATLQLASSAADGEGVDAAAAESMAKHGRELLLDVASLNSGNDFDGDLGQLAAVMAQRVSRGLPAFEMLYLLSQIRASLGAAFLQRVLAALDAIATAADADGAARSAEESAVLLLLRGRCVFGVRLLLCVLCGCFKGHHQRDSSIDILLTIKF